MNIQNVMRSHVAKFLPDAIETALLSYQIFINKENTDKTVEPKNFKEHHDACKVALAHVQLLIKLAEWAAEPDPGQLRTIHQESLMAMITDAKNDIITVDYQIEEEIKI